MHKNIAAIVIIVLVAGGLVLFLGRLWPQTASVKGDQEIYRLVEQARGDLAKAGVLLNDPVYTKLEADETPPLPALTGADRIVTLPDAVNPKAWTAIADADDSLVAALATHTEADPAVRSLGMRMLAEINKLKGDYHAERAAIARRQADVALAKADGVLDTISLGRRARQYQQSLAEEMLEGPSNEEMVRTRAEAVASREAAGGRLAEISAAIDGLSAEVADLTDNIDRLAEQEMALRQDSRTNPSAAEAKDLLNQALDIKGQIDSLKNVLADKDRQIELAQQAQQLVRAEIESLDGQIAATEAALAERQDLAQNKDVDIAEAAKVVADAEAELASALEQLKTAADEASEANSTAIEYFGKAVANAELALREIRRDDLLLLGRKAQLLALLAKTRMDDSAVQGRMDALAGSADQAYAGAVSGEISAQIADLQSYVANPVEQDEMTINELGDSADLLERVTRAGRGDKRADYLGQLADVYFLRYQMTGEDSDRSKGEQRLRDAKSARGEPTPDDPLERIHPVGPHGEPAAAATTE